MTQSQYGPPTPPSGPWGLNNSSGLLRRGAASAAAIWLLVIGTLLTVAGTCIGAVAWVMPASVFEEQMRLQGASIRDVPGWTAAQIVKVALYTVSITSFLLGVLLIVLALFVRRGGRGVIIASLVSVGILSCFLVIDLASGLSQTGGNAAVWLPVLLIAGMLGLCISAIRKLVEALQESRTGRQVIDPRAMRQQLSAGMSMWGYPLPPPGSGPVGEVGYYGAMPQGSPPILPQRGSGGN